jgi:zinc transport system substrate-binding protein
MLRINRASNAIVLLPLLFLGCGSGEDAGEADTRSLVAVSIYPLGDLVQQIIGEAARVEVLLPQGASPATFDVSPRQIVDLRGASLFVMIGGGLDEWLIPLTEATGRDSPVLRVSDGIPLLAGDGEAEEEVEELEDEHGHEHAHDEGTGNPHIWLDPILMRDEVLPKLGEALVVAFPSEAQGIRERVDLLSDSLAALDAEIRAALEPLEQRAFIATHSAWTYYAARYGLVEAGVVHAHPGHEPSSQEIAHLLEAAQEHGLTCIFTEPQLGETAVRAIATELALPTRLLDPLGGPEMEGRSSYAEILRFNTRQLVEGLGGGEG